MNYLYYLIAIVPSIVLHEVSHGWVANYFGDPTAKQQGRLTINPLKHIDPFGTVLLPALLIFSGLPMFGYAKPVPVNVSRLRNPRKQSLYVSIAGPLVNIFLSGVGFAICEYAIHSTQSQTTFNIGEYLGLVNITLAAFNLIPIPPLDGSAILERFIPQRNLAKYYDVRSKALPFFMVFIIVDSMFLHVGTGFLGNLQNWWISQLF
jgi:Zn-dependent protease